MLFFIFVFISPSSLSLSLSPFLSFSLSISLSLFSLFLSSLSLSLSLSHSLSLSLYLSHSLYLYLFHVPCLIQRDAAVAGVAPLRNNDWNITSVGENAVASVYQSDVSLLSLRNFDEHVRIRLGGLVMSRSVKFLGKLEATLSDQETREGWWEELRDEIKNHARTVCCTHVVGYTETCTIFGDVCVLSAVGTAAVVKYLGYPTTSMNAPSDPRVSPLLCNQPLNGSVRRDSKNNEKNSNGGNESEEGGDEYDDDEEEEEELEPDEFGSGMKISRRKGSQPLLNLVRNIPKSPFQGTFLGTKSPIVSEKSSGKSQQTSGASDFIPIYNNSTNRQERTRRVQRPCSYVHVPYNHSNAPFSFLRLVPCISCRRKWVPETILATIEPSPALVIRGSGHMLEARVCRTRKAAIGETDAVKISELLPFVEFDVQKQLMLKLKVAGMNACFGYTCKIQIGSDIVIAMATCTAVFLEALPPSPALHFLRAQQPNKNNIGEQDGRLIKMQKDLEIMYQTNKDLIEIAAASAIALEDADGGEEKTRKGVTGTSGDFIGSSMSEGLEGHKRLKVKENVPFTRTGTYFLLFLLLFACSLLYLRLLASSLRTYVTIYIAFDLERTVSPSRSDSGAYVLVHKHQYIMRPSSLSCSLLIFF